MKLNKNVWGPHYWFVLHTIALTYPKNPNDTIKKKYYDFIMNLNILIPDMKIAKKFSEMIDKFPVTPYLDSKESFMKWMHFMHNKINILDGKPTIKYEDSLELYYKNYDLDKNSRENKIKKKQMQIKIGFIVLLLSFIGVNHYFENN